MIARILIAIGLILVGLFYITVWAAKAPTPARETIRYGFGIFLLTIGSALLIGE